MSMKKLSGLVSIILLSAGIGAAQAADTAAPQIKVAVVNVQQVLQQSSRVTAMSKKLESQFKERQQKITDEQKALQDELDKFKKESPTMAQKAKEDMQKKIANDRSELVKKVVAYQQALNQEQAKVMQGILGELNGIVGKIAKNKSFALVLDSQAVVYSENGADITSEVAKEFNDKK